MSTQATLTDRQVALPRTAAEVTAPATGVVMHPAYAKTIGQFAYVWGWPMVNMLNRCGAIQQRSVLPPEPAEAPFARDQEQEPEEGSRRVVDALRWGEIARRGQGVELAARTDWEPYLPVRAPEGTPNVLFRPL
jgi:hypothetical protein